MTNKGFSSSPGPRAIAPSEASARAETLATERLRLLDPYEAYYAAMTRAGITPLSREWYNRAIAAKPAKRIDDTQWDHDREREGDAQ